MRLQRTKQLCRDIWAYIREFHSPNFSKQSPAICLTGPTEFRQNRKLNHRALYSANLMGNTHKYCGKFLSMLSMTVGIVTTGIQRDLRISF
jgi:hypothetical protein